ncbi:MULTISPECIES: recombination regulator RecX [Vibrio]|jgi:regulatory protein|uniref:Regulatory protein RecX n=2 Tax=Vibrio TaxID=662 RepID=A0A2S9ZJ37_9VIBR|nr:MULTISPECIES: recombination regulator RecX [Vibrio]AYV21748.1 recombination regulator RecX [Vibrio mediterranei]KFA96159.1 recombinase RecX [Vibrio sp. ER1A]MCF4176016.1 recombination regulator RecX [Vibrio sp. McD22-P3]MCG9659051.1 recombination regulator RecX [Vibrio mediterranei]MCG9785686.1 recombination regulator RecX [Vibrio mediterranei]
MFQRKPPSLSAKEAAIQLLSRRDHGEYELYQKLAFKGYEESEVEAALDFCRDCRYLDDLRFAKSQIRQHVYKGHGERRIRQELNQKRVSDSVVDEAMLEEQVDWFELAKTTAEKKFRLGKSKDPKEYAKQVRFLQYRGYTFEQINYALNALENP